MENNKGKQKKTILIALSVAAALALIAWGTIRIMDAVGKQDEAVPDNNTQQITEPTYNAADLAPNEILLPDGEVQKDAGECVRIDPESSDMVEEVVPCSELPGSDIQ